jgi:DNA-binding FadR family transcriptional regulator
MATWYNLLWKTQRMARKKIFKRNGNPETIASHHLALFKAIKAGDKEKASRIARDHMDFVAEELRRVLTEEQTS